MGIPKLLALHPRHCTRRLKGGHSQITGMQISVYQFHCAIPFENFLRGLLTNEKPAFQAPDQPEDFISQDLQCWPNLNSTATATQETDRGVGSEVPVNLLGGNSQNVGTPPHTPTPRYNQSSLGVSGVGIHKMLALHPRHRHPGTIRAP